MATRTMSPLAWRGNQLNRASLSALCSELWVPLATIVARTHETRICARYCFTRRPHPPFGFESSGAPLIARQSRRKAVTRPGSDPGRVFAGTCLVEAATRLLLLLLLLLLLSPLPHHACADRDGEA